MDFLKIDTIPYWSMAKEELVSLLQTKVQGLSEDEAARRLKLFGPNDLAKKKKGAFILRFLSKFTNPLILILIFASLLAGILGELTNFFIILSIIVVSAVIDFYQQYQAEGAVEKLRRKVSLTTTVLRDGLKREIPLSQIVPGDIIFLSAGDIVPADGRILNCRDLLIDQASLTGESYPQEKQAEIQMNPSTLVVGRTNSVFMGTHVLLGEGQAIVAKTGEHTEFGHVSKALVERRPPTEFEKGIQGFGLMIMKITVVLVLFVFFINAFLRGEILNSLLFSLALAIGLAPELLPMILTINLSRGALRMAKKQVIVKDLPAIQNFGSMEVLCTDKTGTLTEGRIKLATHEDMDGKRNEDVLLFGYLNSAHQAGLKSPLDQAVLEYHKEVDTREYKPRGSPRLTSAELSRMPERGDRLSSGEGAPAFKKIDEVPFDFSRRRLSVIFEHKQKYLFITSGAPEGIFPLCNFSERLRRKVEERFKQISLKGLRVLAVAVKNVDLKKDYSINDEQDLTFLGLLTFNDPPKKTAPEALQQLEKQGVELKILTGDNELVTQKICEDIGLPVKNTLLGSDIDKLNDEALVEQAQQVSIFARVDPEQKERIILALKKGNLVVGFLGDGINDALSLRVADIGISVENAVDVAKESADLILLRKDLHVLKDGVYEGRKTHGNVMKYLMMGTSSDFGNMFSLACTSLFLPFLPMLPVQILLNDLLYDVTQLAIPSDNVDSVYIQKPKKWDINFIKKFMLIFGPISSIFDFLTFFLLLLVFRASHQMFQTGWFLESITTQTLIVFSIRTKVVPFFKSRPSSFLAFILFAVVFIAWVIPLSPFAGLFSFVSVPTPFYLILLVLLSLYFLLGEMAKRWFYKRDPGGVPSSL